MKRVTLVFTVDSEAIYGLPEDLDAWESSLQEWRVFDCGLGGLESVVVEDA